MRGVDEVFLAAKVDLQARDKDGNTPLHLAANAGTADVFKWLLKNGASLDATNSLGKMPQPKFPVPLRPP